MTDIYEIAEYTLEALKKSGADAAQCIVSKSKKDELNVDGGKFSLMRSTFNTSISMKAIKDGKKGVTSINQATKEAIDEAAAQCISAAQSSVPDEAEQIAPFTAKAEYKTGVFEPELDKLRAETAAMGDLIEQEEDILTYAQFGQVATKFFEKRAQKKKCGDPDGYHVSNITVAAE